MINTIKRIEALARTFTTVSPNYKFKYNTSMIPHPSKAGKGGEDALFAHDNLLAVADGVGGWASYGVDPGIFSKKLCRLIGEIYMGDKEQYYSNPAALIPKAVSLNKQTGTATICIVALNPVTGQMNTAYIGDSVFSIYRKQEQYKLHFLAEENQRQFNFPYQVGTEGDDPAKSLQNAFQCQVNDLVVVGSDGLWDNLQLQTMTTLLKSTAQQTLAHTLGTAAYHKSLSHNRASPFSVKAKKAGLHFPPSGKPDDITVITARVVRE